MAQEKILIIDDERSVRESIRMTLKGDFQVFTADNGKDALAIVKQEKLDLVLLDIVMPGMDGMEVLKKIREIDKKVTVIMITATKSMAHASGAIKLGASDYIAKPFEAGQIRQVVQKALQGSSKKKHSK